MLDLINLKRKSLIIHKQFPSKLGFPTRKSFHIPQRFHIIPFLTTFHQRALSPIHSAPNKILRPSINSPGNPAISRLVVFQSPNAFEFFSLSYLQKVRYTSSGSQVEQLSFAR